MADRVRNDRIWDIISVKTQDQVRTGLIRCLEATHDDQADEERNNLCKTASYIAEGDSTRGCMGQDTPTKIVDAEYPCQMAGMSWKSP